MIYAIGLDSDPTFLGFVRSASTAGADIQVVSLGTVAREPWRFAVPAATGESAVHQGGERVVLEPHGAYFLRLIDLSTVVPAAEADSRRHLLTSMSAFLETVSGPIINRPGAHVHNGAKPLHEAWLLRRGFDVPPSITGSSGDAIREFIAAQGRCVVKALCGARGEAREVTAEEFAEFDSRQGPIHVQRLIPGDDVRAHVVGDEVHAELIASDRIDYRAADATRKYRPHTLPDNLRRMIIEGSAALGLVFTGWDFKVDCEGRYHCLEVNPMPGYDSYDRRANGAITASLLSYLGHGHAHDV